MNRYFNGFSLVLCLILAARKLLTQYFVDDTAEVLKQWWKLAEELYIKYDDGYLNTRAGIAQAVFCPAWWLRQVDFEAGPTGYEKPAAGKGRP